MCEQDSRKVEKLTLLQQEKTTTKKDREKINKSNLAFFAKFENLFFQFKNR
jgi:hypothetical protein